MKQYFRLIIWSSDRLTFHEVMAEERAARTRMIGQAPVFKCRLAPVVDGTLVVDEPMECEVKVHSMSLWWGSEDAGRGVTPRPVGGWEGHVNANAGDASV